MIAEKNNIVFYDKIYNETIEGNVVFVNVLENSKIQAHCVYVKKCRNSVIEADKIFIEQLLTHNEIFPFQHVVIDENIGDNNIIVVDFYSDLNKDEDYQALSKSIAETLNKNLISTKTLHSFLFHNQAKIFEIKGKEIKTNVEKKFLSDYLNILKKYNDEISKYETLLKLKFSLDLRIKIIKDYPYNTNIWINTKNIRKNNLLQFHTSLKKKIKSFISEMGLFYLSRNNVVVRKDFSTIEDEVNKEMLSLKSFGNAQKF